MKVKPETDPWVVNGPDLSSVRTASSPHSDWATREDVWPVSTSLMTKRTNSTAASRSWRRRLIHLPSGLDRVDCERQEEEDWQYQTKATATDPALSAYWSIFAVISTLPTLTAGLSLHTKWHKCCTWWALCVLYVICTWLCLGHLSVCVGDSSRCSEEIGKNLKLCLFNSIVIIIIMIFIWQVPFKTTEGSPPSHIHIYFILSYSWPLHIKGIKLR